MNARSGVMVFAAMLAALALAGCGSQAASSGSGARGSGASSAGTAASGSSRTIPIMPGRTAKRGGRVTVVGTLQRDDAGGWIVVDAVPAQAASGHVVAVIVNPGNLQGGNLSSLENSYVRITGTPPGGLATDAKDLKLVVDKIEPLSAK